MRSHRYLALLGDRAGVRALSLVAAIACALFLPSCGPRMENQQSLRPYKQQFPSMPDGATPISGRTVTFAVEQSKLTNPLPATSANIRDGRIYYGYYCLMCHGSRGDGNGPVGESYLPKPTDLSSPTTSKMADGQLYKAMLSGTGHDPVMIDTVLPRHRWPLVLYVRQFAK